MADSDQRAERPTFVRDLMLVGAGALASYGVTSVLQDQAEAAQAEAVRSERAIELYEEYESLSAVAESAGNFARGAGGREEDLVTMFRHFRKLTVLIANDNVDAWAVADLYKGRLNYWSDMFAVAAKSDEALNWKMRTATLEQMEAISGFLRILFEQSNGAGASNERQSGENVFIADPEFERSLSAASDAAEGAVCAAAGCCAAAEEAAEEAAAE